MEICHQWSKWLGPKIIVSFFLILLCNRTLASSIKKPFELRYNPYTQSVQTLSSSGKIMDIAKELKGDVFLIANAIRKIQVSPIQIFSKFKFPALLKRELATIPWVILTSPSGSLASDLFWSDIWGDLVKISRRKQRTEREENKWFVV